MTSLKPQSSDHRSFWPRPRFSIRAMLLWTAVIAAGIALSGFFLRRASQEGWSSLAFWATASLLTLSLLMAANRQELSRSYWTGFAICGWTYFLLVVCGFAYVPQFGRALAKQETLITTRVSNRVYLAFYAQPRGGGFGGGAGGAGFGGGGFGGPGPPGVWVPGPTPVPGRLFVAIDDFVDVAHLLWALAIAFCGGWVSVLLYASGRRGKRAADVADARG